MRVEMIVVGDFDDEIENTDQIIDQSAEMLDSCQAAEIIPQNLFKGEDGKFYTVTTEAIIGEVNPIAGVEIIEDELSLLGDPEDEDFQDERKRLQGFLAELNKLVAVAQTK